MDTKTANASLHWLTATIPIMDSTKTEMQAKQIAERAERCTTTTDARPYPHNYTNALKATLGTISWHETRPDMRICYNISGSGLDQAYKHDLAPLRIFDALMSMGARVTRVDIALDWPERVDIGALVDIAKQHPDCVHARTLTPYNTIKLRAGEVNDRTTGLYVGSLRSDRFLCIYDKGLELGLSDVMLKRIEARNRAYHARQAAATIASETLPVAARSIIKSLADFPIGWWESALSGPITALEPIGRKETDTERWLCEDIAPVVARVIKDTGGMSSLVYQTFAKLIIDATSIDT